MKKQSVKDFLGDVKATLKETKDSYIYFAGILVLFIILLSVLADHFLPGVFIVLMLFLVAPFLMALASYFVTTSKNSLDQKQRFFFQLVKQFYRFDSIRIFIPLRNLLLSLLLTFAVLYLSSMGVLIYAFNFDPAAKDIYQQFLSIVNTADYDAAMAFLNNNLSFIDQYSFYPSLLASIGFAFFFSYFLLNRLFFVLLHCNLYNKSKLKVDFIKRKYFEPAFKRQIFRKYTSSLVLPILLLAGLLASASGVLLYLFNGALEPATIILLSILIYIILIFMFYRYLITVYLMLFGKFMEHHAGNLFRESIADIDVMLQNTDLDADNKQRLIEIKALLEAQIKIFELQKETALQKEDEARENAEANKPTSEE